MSKITIQIACDDVAEAGGILAALGNIETAVEAVPVVPLPTRAETAVTPAQPTPLAPTVMPEPVTTVKPIAPTAAPTEVDKDGTPWDERIHAGTKTQTAKGIWKKRKGVDKETFDTVMSEITGATMVTAPTTEAVTPPTVAPAPSPADMTPAAPVTPLPTPPVAAEAPYQKLMLDMMQFGIHTNDDNVTLNKIIHHYSAGAASNINELGALTPQQLASVEQAFTYFSVSIPLEQVKETVAQTCG